MSGTLLLDWKVGQYEYAYFEYKATPDKVGTIFDLSVSRQGFSDTPLKAKSVEIDVINNTQTYSFTSYVDIEIDGNPKRIFAKYQFNTENTQTIKIVAQTAGAVKFKFYSEEVFDYIQYDRLFADYLSNEPTNEIVYTTNIRLVGGVWKWDVNNTFPFNSGNDVSIPIKLRDANPYRSQFYLSYQVSTTVANMISFSGDGIEANGESYHRNLVSPLPMFFSIGNTNYCPTSGLPFFNIDVTQTSTFSMTAFNSGCIMDDSQFGGVRILDKSFAPIRSVSLTGLDTGSTGSIIGPAFGGEIWVKVLPRVNPADIRTLINATTSAMVY